MSKESKLDFFQTDDKTQFSPCDQGHIGINFGTKNVM